MVQNDKKFCLLHFISQEPYIIWLSFMVHICKMIIFSSVLFIFSKILIFWILKGLKGQKMVQNDKRFCLLHAISQEPYIIWLSFIVEICKIIIPPVVFLNFKILIFWVVRGLKGNCTSGTVHHMIVCKMMIFPANFFIFQNFDFWGFYGGKRAKDDLKLPISVCFALYLRNCRSYHQDFDNDIYRCFSLFFFKKTQHCKY